MSDKKKPLYLCYARGCYTIMNNTAEAQKEHFIEEHGWTEQDWKDYND
jgi:hypothetical protein